MYSVAGRRVCAVRRGLRLGVPLKRPVWKSCSKAEIMRGDWAPSAGCVRPSADRTWPGIEGRSWEVVAKAPLVVCSVCRPARRPTAQEPAWCACAKMFRGGGFSRSHVQGINSDGSPGLQELCEYWSCWWCRVACVLRRRMIWKRSAGYAPVKSAPGYMCVRECVCACIR